MKELRIAEKSDLLRIKEIWKSCFVEDEIYTEHYFRHRFLPENIAVLLWKGRIVSILTMIPVSLTVPGRQGLGGTMFYGIATDPDVRGRGYAGQLITYANALVKERNLHFSVLVPAEVELFGFYEKLGYKAEFFLKEWVLSKERILQMAQISPFGKRAGSQWQEELLMSPLDSTDYQEIREVHCADFTHLSYELNEISYQQKTAQLVGADLWGFSRNGRRGCATLEWMDDHRLMVKEMLISEEDLLHGLLAVTKQYPAKEYYLRLPSSLGSFIQGGEVRPFAMIDDLAAEIEQPIELNASEAGLAYLGLAFD